MRKTILFSVLMILLSSIVLADWVDITAERDSFHSQYTWLIGNLGPMTHIVDGEGGVPVGAFIISAIPGDPDGYAIRLDDPVVIGQVQFHHYHSGTTAVFPGGALIKDEVHSTPTISFFDQDGSQRFDAEGLTHYWGIDVSDGPDNTARFANFILYDSEIPEFSIYGIIAVIAVIVLGAVFIYHKKKKQ